MRGKPRLGRRLLALGLAVNLVFAGGPLGTPTVQAAGPAWYDGLIQYSTITNCVSIIQGSPYQEYGAGAYTGFFANPDANLPAPNTTYYLHVVVYGLGNACSGQRFLPEIALPANTALAITVGTPVYCFAGGVSDPGNCPQTLPASGTHPGAFSIFSPDSANAYTWPLPQGGNWEFQIPVRSTTTLSNSTFAAYVKMFDGNSSPTLTATQGAYVFGVNTPTVLYPSPSTTGIGKTTATSSANLYSGGLAGNAYFDIGTTTSYGLFSDGPAAIPSTGSNWLVTSDWTPYALQPDTLYHWRIRFQVTATGTWYYGADQTFRTLGAATSVTVGGISSSVAGGTKSSVTVTAKDATNTTATGYRGTVHFTSSDPNALLPADYTFTAADAGTHTFTNAVTLMTQGTHEVRARDTATSTITGAQTNILITSTDPAPTATLTRPASPTKATTLAYTATFSEAVTGLAAADFARTGTATGCIVNAPTGTGLSRTINVTGCSAGTVILALKAGAVTDSVGNRGPATKVTASTVTIDRTVPTSTAPAATLRTGVGLAGTAIPIRLDWTGSDTGGVGVARYELSSSPDGGTTWTVISATLTAATRNLTVPSTGTVRFRVRAVDRAGNVGAWKTGPNLAPGLIQESSAGITFTGTWATATSASYSGGSAKYASAAGASASYSFTGRAVALVLTKAASRGAVKIYIDGVLKATVDSYAATTSYRIMAWQWTWSSVGAHTVKVVVVGTAGRPRVDLDAFAVLR